ncbi:hypothetical protein ALI22I_20520 [Saccharothrix sp. ALI-22-I]|uniref:hypothetical protein n=1 Tax=Saccharothrix sp. ALI-22-I TaxID=1933778 RepID=UPI00097C57FD|nr:hypothetical protein [Saccharothrix sp. ALI-22-I]ONI88125.1 hypothetical protein ALI22I_20520 [Saccharothrix sp. ALI-22-I]
MTTTLRAVRRRVAAAIGFQRPKVVLSLGMGIDSIALLVRWILNPDTRNFDLRDLVVVTAMTGEEHDYTRRYMEKHVLPLMRRNRIRYVQIARAGQLARHGYVVLDDSRSPRRMHMRGPWRLSYELRKAGTLPSVRKKMRWCSDRAKGQVIDWWVADHIDPGYTHVVGFAAEEQFRADRDREARREKEKKNEKRRRGSRKIVPCTPAYPLINWGFSREKSAAYLKFVFKEAPRRSCCTMCPFTGAIAGSRPELIARWREFPEAGADAIELEYVSLALNPKIGAFGVDDTAFDLAAENDLEALRIAQARIAACETWSLMEIRRGFDAKGHDPRLKGQAWRSVRTRATGTRAQMRLTLLKRGKGAVETDRFGIDRVWRKRRAAEGEGEGEPILYPAVEVLYVIVPQGVANKQRPSFEAKWVQMNTARLNLTTTTASQ